MLYYLDWYYDLLCSLSSAILPCADLYWLLLSIVMYNILLNWYFPAFSIVGVLSWIIKYWSPVPHYEVLVYPVLYCHAMDFHVRTCLLSCIDILSI